RDWLDLFNHLFISLFYRAWEKYRFHIPYDRGEPFRSETDTFTLGVRSLMGFGSPGHRDRVRVERAAPEADADDLNRYRFAEPRAALAGPPSPLPRTDARALLSFAGFSPQRPRNATTLRPLLADYSRVGAAAQQSRGQWLAIPEDPQTRLGQFGTLGVNA